MFRCFECSQPAHHAHHVVPKSLGGKRTIPLCTKCHTKIHDITKTSSSYLIKQGMKRAKMAGKHIGRPKANIDMELLQKLVTSQIRASQIASILGVSLNTAKRRIKELNENPKED